jgi:hypothetical protein
MSARCLCLWIALCGVLQLAAACSFDSNANEARGCDEQCAVCRYGYCVMTIEQAATAPDATMISGNGGTHATGGGGASMSVGGASGAGAGGSAGTNISGAGGSAGTSISGAGGAGAIGGAGAGAGGAPPGCVPTAELCNTLDDDCDGAIDEDTSVACYPAGTDGCAISADGTVACVGMCMAGTQLCEGGVLSACSGFVGPAQEVCGGAEAADENCDGAVDDGCECEGTETQRCYTGPAFTGGVGTCRFGMQTCQGGVFGPCIGSVVPAAETCMNLGTDDDCDRRLDDVPGLGGLCGAAGRLGECFLGVTVCSGGRFACDSPGPAAAETVCDGRDEDCDGRVDETFQLDRDERNCGACGVRCGTNELCCDGRCRNTETNNAHCGACNAACAGSTTCCAGDCVSTTTDDHCGSCNVTCNANQDCCGGSCLALDTDTHCGGCNIVCGPNQDCCASACTDVSTANNCGGCNIVCPAPCTCTAGGSCQDEMGAACL